MQKPALHIRFHLWSKRVPRDQWAAYVAKSAACSLERAEALLTEARPTPEEADRLVDEFGLDQHEFLTLAPQFDPEWVLSQNISYLLDSLEHGGRKRLAEHLGVDATTVSAWGRGRRRPRRANLEGLRHFFGIPASTDLEADLLFLLDVPVSHIQRRQWVTERLSNISPEVLKDLFPALERLLGK